MTTRQQAIGRWGENLAEKYLTQKGYNILARNLRSEYGEIDILAENEGVLAFVEVKTRTNLVFGNPESAITPRKLAHMRAAALAYIQNHPAYDDLAWRVDVLAILQLRNQRDPEILHFENVLS